MNIIDLLTSPEGKALEFKRDLSPPKPIVPDRLAIHSPGIYSEDGLVEWPAIQLFSDLSVRR